MKRLNKSVRINPQFSWTDWELYDSEGTIRATELLNKLLADLVNAGCDRRETFTAMANTMSSESFRELGAADSEPLRFLEDILDEVYGE